MLKDVIIRGNHFADYGYNNGSAAIAIEPESKIIDPEKPFLRNQITIDRKSKSKLILETNKTSNK